MVFCNKYDEELYTLNSIVTILILIDGFLQFIRMVDENPEIKVSQSLF